MIYERLHAAVPESLRKELAWTFAFAVPSEAALEEIARHAPVVEVGAGTGYWAWRLQSRGAVVRAYDRTPGFPLWCEVREGGPERAGEGGTLLLCWPPLEEDLASRALAAYGGDRLLYVGERGPEARTGDVEFHARLGRDWVAEAEIRIPRWEGFRDSLWVFRRATASGDAG